MDQAAQQCATLWTMQYKWAKKRLTHPPRRVGELSAVLVAEHQFDKFERVPLVHEALVHGE
eukprot:1792661-Amphidinium_carterae.1